METGRRQRKITLDAAQERALREAADRDGATDTATFRKAVAAGIESLVGARPPAGPPPVAEGRGSSGILAERAAHDAAVARRASLASLALLSYLAPWALQVLEALGSEAGCCPAPVRAFAHLNVCTVLNWFLDAGEDLERCGFDLTSAMWALPPRYGVDPASLGVPPGDWARFDPESRRAAGKWRSEGEGE